MGVEGWWEPDMDTVPFRKVLGVCQRNTALNASLVQGLSALLVSWQCRTSCPGNSSLQLRDTSLPLRRHHSVKLRCPLRLLQVLCSHGGFHGSQMAAQHHNGGLGPVPSTDQGRIRHFTCVFPEVPSIAPHVFFRAGVFLWDSVCFSNSGDIARMLPCLSTSPWPRPRPAGSLGNSTLVGQIFLGSPADVGGRHRRGIAGLPPDASVAESAGWPATVAVVGSCRWRL